MLHISVRSAEWSSPKWQNAVRRTTGRRQNVVPGAQHVARGADVSDGRVRESRGSSDSRAQGNIANEPAFVFSIPFENKNAVCEPRKFLIFEQNPFGSPHTTRSLRLAPVRNAMRVFRKEFRHLGADFYQIIPRVERTQVVGGVVMPNSVNTIRVHRRDIGLGPYFAAEENITCKLAEEGASQLVGMEPRFSHVPGGAPLEPCPGWFGQDRSCPGLPRASGGRNRNKRTSRCANQDVARKLNSDLIM